MYVANLSNTLNHEKELARIFITHENTEDLLVKNVPKVSMGII